MKNPTQQYRLEDKYADYVLSAKLRHLYHLMSQLNTCKSNLLRYHREQYISELGLEEFEEYAEIKGLHKIPPDDLISKYEKFCNLKKIPFIVLSYLTFEEWKPKKKYGIIKSSCEKQLILTFNRDEDKANAN